MITNQQKANRKKWIDALRSGEYKQARGYLALKDVETEQMAYCCLGVLCELALGEGAVKRTQAKLATNTSVFQDDTAMTKAANYFAYGSEGYTGELPVAVQKWAGIGVESTSRFIDMNDKDGASFEDIARDIERRFKLSS